MSIPLSFSSFLPLASSPTLLTFQGHTTSPSTNSPRIPCSTNPEISTSNIDLEEQDQHRQAGSQDEMSAFDFQPNAMTSNLPVYSSPPPPPNYKPSTLTFQQSPLGSHPLPELPPPPPSYKRSPSPSPSTTSQPSLHELPKYTPLAVSVSTTATASKKKTKARPNVGSWAAAWNPWNWTSGTASERSQCASEGGGGSASVRGRDPMAGRMGDELDACERYEVNQKRLREQQQGNEGSDYCCGCFWAGPPMPMSAYYMF